MNAVLLYKTCQDLPQGCGIPLEPFIATLALVIPYGLYKRFT